MQQYIIFRLGESHYATPVSQVATILRNDVRLSRPLPAPGRIGLRDHQGRVWGVIDLGYLLFKKETHVAGNEMLLLLSDGRAGVLVSEVLAVQTIHDDQMKTVRLDDGEHRIAHLNTGLAVLLELGQLVARFLGQGESVQA